MTSKDITCIRLANQQLTTTSFSTPEELVGYMGCIQAQDYAGAKWAIGCRLHNITNAEVEQSFNEGKILRTHVLRPTWHFVLPADIGWMLQLTASKVKALSKPYHAKLGLDERILKRSKTIITRALHDHKKMTREAIIALLKKEKINIADGRAGFLLLDAGLDGLICNAGRQGKQFIYILLDDLKIKPKHFDRDEALAELAKRYFISHGPATAQDFARWSGLNLTDAKKGLDMNKALLAHEIVNGQAYWFSPKQQTIKPKTNTVYILPPFDEYTVAYKNRKDVVDPKFHSKSGSGLAPSIIHNGQMIGTWKKTEVKDKISIEASYFDAANEASAKAMASAYKRYSAFIGQEIVISGSD